MHQVRTALMHATLDANGVLERTYETYGTTEICGNKLW